MMATKLNGEYRAYDKVVNDETIKTMFEARYGYRPVIVVEAGPVKLAGPIHPGTELEPGESVTVGGGQ